MIQLNFFAIFWNILMFTHPLRASLLGTLAAILLIPVSHAASDVPETITVELHFTPDLENGKRVYAVCESCHLPDGWGNRDGVYPQLAGQHASVLMKQLLDIREGRRDNPVMYPFVQERTIGGYQNLADVVAYISTLPMTPNQGQGRWGRSSAEYLEGERLYQEKCAACHGVEGEGNSVARFPRLQGQHYAYLLHQARLIATWQRKADPAMEAILATLSDEQIRQIMNYVSRIPVPREDLEDLSEEEK